MYKKHAPTLREKIEWSENKECMSLLYHMEFGKVTVMLCFANGFYSVVGSGNLEYPCIKGDTLSRWKVFHKSTMFYSALRSFCDVCQHVLHNHMIFAYSWRIV